MNRTGNENNAELRSIRRLRRQAVFIRAVVFTAITLSVLALGFIVVYVLIRGIPNITPDLFAFEYTSENCSLLPALINTVTMTFMSLLIAVPLGVFSAIFLVEYSKRGSRLIGLIRSMTETLSGIPSIIYGLFGYLVFSVALGWGFSVLAGAITLSIMILPVIIRTTEEALKSIPDSYREGSFAVGAGKVRTVFKVILPSAVPGILAGIVLATGRIVGETAALVFTAGTVAQVPDSVMQSGRTLSIHMYALWSEGLNTDKAYATAVILLVIVVGLNALSAFIAKKMMKGHI